MKGISSRVAAAAAAAALTAFAACSSGTHPSQGGVLVPPADAGVDEGGSDSGPLSEASVGSPDGEASPDAAADVFEAGPSANASAIAVGAAHACALTTDGRVLCWGDNNRGQLGDGTTVPRSRPVLVSGLAGVRAIAAGDEHTCALDSAGGVWCWGDNASGSIGDGSSALQRLLPTPVSGLAGGVTAIGAGGATTCARTASGSAVCWGANVSGQLGDGTNEHRNIPVAVTGYVTTLAPGSAVLGPAADHTCVVNADTSVLCAGADANGALGNSGDLSTTSFVVSGVTGGGVAVGSSNGASCALISDGTVNCWGFGGSGALGNGATSTSNMPVAVMGITDATAIGVGLGHACAVTPEGLRCWGDNANGDLGDGSGVQQNAPVAVAGLPSDGVVAVAAGGGTCALTAPGAVFCWGANDSGQIGDGTNTARPTPVPVFGLP